MKTFWVVAPAAPAHEIFYDRFFKIALCTDEFALQAGGAGMRFLDPTHLILGGSHHRTLRGVEELGAWDPVRKSLRSKLIREIS